MVLLNTRSSVEKIITFKLSINISKIARFLRKNLGALIIIPIPFYQLAYSTLVRGGYLGPTSEVLVYTYYALVIGIILQIVSFLQNNEQ